MTIYQTPTITDEQIDAMEPFEAYRLGEDLLASRFPRHAARVLKRVVELEPEQSGAWELLGRSHFAAAQLRPAEAAFRRLIDLEPTSGWAHTALARTLERQSKHREGAVMHRIADALGVPGRDATRVELVDSPAGIDSPFA